MWFTVIAVLILIDFFKPPIDLLYFQNPWRPLVGIRNTIIDALMHRRTYDHNDYAGLWKVKANFWVIRREFYDTFSKTNRYYFHDLDKWFEKNKTYYYYKVEDFPKVYELLKSIPCVDETTAVFSVIEGPMTLAPHRAESNTQLRYHLTIESGKDCILETEYGVHMHMTGEEFLFDHARYHALTKRGHTRRITLILDIRRY